MAWLSLSRTLPFLLLAVLVLLSGCNSGNIRKLTDAGQTRNLTASESNIWASAEDLDKSIRNRRMIYSDKQATAYVREIMQRLYPEFNDVLRVRLIDSPDLNAFVLPNGSVYINIGLLARLDNEAQLATVLAHEASHFTFQHSLKQREGADGTILVGIGVEVLTGIPLSGTLLTHAVLSSYSRGHESEADREGFKRLRQTGYAIKEAPKTFEILLEEVKTLDIDQPYMFSSHPKLENRIETFNALIKEADSGEGRVATEAYLNITRPIREVILGRYLAMHRYKTLILILENAKLKARYPDYADYYLGEAYRQRNEEGDLEQAVNTFKALLSAGVTYPPVHKSLGEIYLKTDKPEEAARHFNQYLALAPEAKDGAYVKAYPSRLEKEKP